MPDNIQITCDPHRIEAFLQQQLSAREQSEFETHLDECRDCRDRLEASAASEELWSAVRESLSSDPSSMDLNDSAASDQTQFSHQTILDWLAPTDDDRMLGRLGNYEIKGIVGSGGMAVVLKAFDPALNRNVAIKVLAPHLGSSGAARRRFSREAQASAAVVHENVIEIHGVSEKDGLPYLVMPYISGPSLQRRLDNEGPLEIAEILRIGMQAATGLAAAHSQGLVHRDVKPANILLADGVERVKLTDFGLARAADDASLTKSSVIAGTPQYMSPEQARGETIDQRSDLFSLGSVLYAMCTGRAPFRAETPYGVLRRITDDEHRPIREINPEIPAWLCQIIDRLMSKDPDDRFQSADEVAELLEQCLAHVQQPTAVPLPESLVPQPKSSFFSNLRRPRLITAFSFLGMGILALLFWQSSAPPDISGKWTGTGWGQVTLERTGRGKYSGTYTDTYGPEKGIINLKWSKVDQRYRGTWGEGQRRSGKISVELNEGQIQGHWTASKKSEIRPGDPEVANLTWVQSDANVPPNVRNPFIGRWKVLSLTKNGTYEFDDNMPVFNFSKRHLTYKDDFGAEVQRSYKLLEKNVVELVQGDSDPNAYGRYQQIDRDTILLALVGGETVFEPPAKAYPAPPEKNVEYYKLVRVSGETHPSSLQNQSVTSVEEYKRLIERRRYKHAVAAALKAKEFASDDDARQLWELRSKFANQLVKARDNSEEEQKLLELMNFRLQRITNSYNAHTLSPPQPVEVVAAVERSEKLPEKSLTDLLEQHPDNLRVIIEPVYDKVEEPRFYPLVGMARLHRVRFKCTLWFNETDELKWPGADRGKGTIEKTVLIDHDHLIASEENAGASQSTDSERPLSATPNENVAGASVPVFGRTKENEPDGDLQFLLLWPRGSKMASMEGQAILELPGRLRMRGSRICYSLTDVPDFPTTRLYGSINRVPVNEQTKQFLNNHAISLKLETGHLELASRGTLTQYVFLPHQQPGEKWAGHFGVLSMGPVDAKSDAEVRRNLKMRGELLVVLQLTGHPPDNEADTYELAPAPESNSSEPSPASEPPATTPNKPVSLGISLQRIADTRNPQQAGSQIRHAQKTAHGANCLPWQDFSEETLIEALKQNKTVLINFSADWCLTCKQNERVALNTKNTLEWVTAHDVVTLYADYTSKSPDLKEWLSKFGNIGVPLTVIYPGDNPTKPSVLQGTFSESTVLGKLEEAAKSTVREDCSGRAK